MPKLRVHNFAISLDGYGAGPDQSTDNPLGVGGERLHEWIVATRTFRQVHGGEGGGDEGLDDQFAARGEVGIGTTIRGRNMFGPIRGPWGDDQWTGWWGDDPPFHHPVFVLTHHPARRSRCREERRSTSSTPASRRRSSGRSRPPTATTSGWGARPATIQQYLRAGLVDELHLAIVPTLLGGGERFFEHLGGGPALYECVEFVNSGSVAHARLVSVAK